MLLISYRSASSTKTTVESVAARERCFNQESSVDKSSVWSLKPGLSAGWFFSQPEIIHSVIFTGECVKPEVNKLGSPVSENLVLFCW